MNIYTKQYRPKYMRQILTELKRKLDCCKKIVGDFNNPLSIMDRISRQKISKEIEVLNNTISLELKDIYETLH